MNPTGIQGHHKFRQIPYVPAYVFILHLYWGIMKRKFWQRTRAAQPQLHDTNGQNTWSQILPSLAGSFASPSSINWWVSFSMSTLQELNMSYLGKAEKSSTQKCGLGKKYVIGPRRVNLGSTPHPGLQWQMSSDQNPYWLGSYRGFYYPVMLVL